MGKWWKQVLSGPIPPSLGICALFVTLAAWLPPADGDPGTARLYDSVGALTSSPTGSAAESAGERKNITAEVVGAYGSSSVHHLLVTEGVKLHFHRVHDETVTILAGAGRMRLGDEVRDVGPGSIVMIPRGTPHSLIVTGDPVEAVSVFSPEFDGKDRVFIDE